MNARLRVLAWILAIVVGIALPGARCSADAGDDQFAVAAAHYAAQRWELAAAEFRGLLNREPGHRLSGDAAFFLGESLMQLRRYSEAAEQFARLNDQTPSHRFARQALFRRGEALYLAGEAKAAEPVLRKFVTQYPDDGSMPYALAYLASSLLKLGQPATADEFFDQALKKFPDGPLSDTCRLGRAEAAESLKRWDDAAGSYEKLLSAPAIDTARVARLRLGLLHNRRQEYDAAIAVLTPLSKDTAAGKLSDEARYAQATAHLGRLQTAEAIALLDPLAKSADPELKARAIALLLRVAATRLTSTGGHAEALKLYNRLISEHPQAAELDEALYQSAWLLTNEYRADDALARFRTLHDRYPKSRYWADATYRLAEAALAAKQYSDVRRLTAEIVASDAPKDLPAHALFLDSQRAVAEQKWSEAESVLEKLIAQSPPTSLRSAAEFWRAEAAYRQEHFDEARKRFDQLAVQPAASSEPWYPSVPLRQAQLAALAKDWPTARRLADEVKQKWPHFERQYETDYVLGRCLAAEAKFDKAREAYRRVTESQSGGKSETAAMAQWMIGESLLLQQQYEPAIREYLRVEPLYAYPRWQAAALLEAGKCYESLGRWSDAAALYERIVKHYGETMFRNEAQQRLAVAEKQAQHRR